ncbi:tyrosine--tRNA ligase [Roseisolibacter sp. H3M3-2]|uniref:tyrosine--tRNA ligase n=1 Tax=Roseisolibacter sp. H3M3-2 TaxID=3031323 RepID=UPI0023DBC01F|nr:tyrosine--tRNA ligase [Roseisolibacter sp. H3M3-2]MDF1502808.1 tyrosine--tRNA ligase [Roseisolibacter sp. H3M3-2]
MSETTAPTPAPLLDELAWRGLLHQTTEGAGAHLAEGPKRIYCGFDPTGASLHVGHLLPIMGLVRLQHAGHRPVALVGGGTGMIGDPSGKSAERQLNTREVVEANADALRAQLERFLDFEGPAAATMANNLDWLAPLDVLSFLRDVGKHFSVNVMLARESVRTRLETGISYTEFSYMLLQAYDFVELRRRLGVTVQIGGSDQWGNMTAGTELVRRMDGGAAHAVTFPLLTTASGQKFGKTEGGAVWLDPERTSPYQFYQFWVNAPDADVGRLLRYFTLLPRERVEALDAATAERPHLREAQQALADEVTTRVHGAEAARVAQEVSRLLFAKGDPRALSGEALAALAAEVPFAEAPAPGEGLGALDVADLYVTAGLVKSKGEARRLLEQGGLTVSGRKLTASERAVTREDVLAGGYLLLRKGARDYALVKVL